MGSTDWYRRISAGSGLDRLTKVFAALFLGKPLAQMLEVTDPAELQALMGLSQDRPNVPSSETQNNRIADVVLPNELFLVRPLSLSAKREKDLWAMAEIDLFRRTPFGRDDVAWVLGRQRLGNVMQYVMRHSQLSEIRRVFRASGISVRRFLTQHDGQLLVLPSILDGRPGWSRKTAAVNGALVAATLVCFLIASGYPVYVANRETAELKVSLEDLRQEATDLRTRLSGIDEATQVKATIHQELRDRWSALDDLKAMTELLPDNVWVGDIKFSQATIASTGQVDGSAASLILDLAQRTDAFTPRLDGAVSRTANGEERFNLTLERVD